MTSNIGANLIQEKMEFLNEKNKEEIILETEVQINKLIKKSLKPEFINRIDEIVFFEPLMNKDIRKIADLLISDLKIKLSKKNLGLEINELAKIAIINKGFNIQYGARPLKRLIQKELTDPISIMILSGEYIDGDTIYIDTDALGSLTFSKNKLKNLN